MKDETSTRMLVCLLFAIRVRQMVMATLWSVHQEQLQWEVVKTLNHFDKKRRLAQINDAKNIQLE